MSSEAKIISYNLYGEQVCASSARISTTPGDAINIFNETCRKENNQKLIEKVLKSGHMSILEHIVFSIAFCNVSAVIEQFFIECRLASFTVKSRRYVDYRNQGYYLPSDLEGSDKEIYIKYMDNLFENYQVLVDKGVPKEDARFLLPYSFNSNFYCTLNARELLHIKNSVLNGRGRDISELKDLMGQIINQLDSICPVLNKVDESNEAIGNYTEDKGFVEDFPKDLIFVGEENAGSIGYKRIPTQISQVLEKAYMISHPGKEVFTDYQELIKGTKLREIEQLNYTFVFNDVTLSGITHLVRHRMQSIIVPMLNDIPVNRFIIPESVKKNNDTCDIYKKAIKSSFELRKIVSQRPSLMHYWYYFNISGNTTDVMTTMNMRELATFIRLRSCNRAQWEVRHIVNRIVNAIRAQEEDIYYLFGPACYMYGSCPEGRLSCGKMEEVTKEFKKSKINSLR